MAGSTRVLSAAKQPQAASGVAIKCPKCGKDFPSKTNAMRHYNIIHLNQRPFKCEQCSAFFCEKRDIHKHLKDAHKASSAQLSSIKMIKYAPLDHLDFVNGYEEEQKKEKKQPQKIQSSKAKKCSPAKKGGEITLSEALKDATKENPIPVSILPLFTTRFSLKAEPQEAAEKVPEKKLKEKKAAVKEEESVQVKRAAKQAQKGKKVSIKQEPKDLDEPQAPSLPEKKTTVTKKDIVPPNPEKVNKEPVKRGRKRKIETESDSSEGTKPSLKTPVAASKPVSKKQKVEEEPKPEKEPVQAVKQEIPEPAEPERNKHACEVCQESFRLKKQLAAHKKDMHKDLFKKTVSCNDCEEVFTLKKALLAHQKEAHSQQASPQPERITCPECPKQFSGKRALANHTKAEHGLLRHSCDFPDCTAKFATEKERADHVIAVHRDQADDPVKEEPLGLDEDQGPEHIQDQDPEAVQDQDPEAVQDQDPKVNQDQDPEALQDQDPEALQDQDPEADQDQDPKAVQEQDQNPVQEQSLEVTLAQEEYPKAGQAEVDQFLAPPEPLKKSGKRKMKKKKKSRHTKDRKKIDDILAATDSDVDRFSSDSESDTDDQEVRRAALRRRRAATAKRAPPAEDFEDLIPTLAIKTKRSKKNV